jgi:hypothetical protein
MQTVLDILVSKENGSLQSLSEIEAVGHRVVHGGEDFSGSVPITDEVIAALEKNVELAPLHNPPNLEGIYTMQRLLPDVPQVGVFDTAFHQSMPEHVYLYAVPYVLYEKYKVRRFGFHGTSHKYVSERACKILGVDINQQKIITVTSGQHIGTITAEQYIIASVASQRIIPITARQYILAACASESIITTATKKRNALRTAGVQNIIPRTAIHRFQTMSPQVHAQRRRAGVNAYIKPSPARHSGVISIKEQHIIPPATVQSIRAGTAN